ncbi:MAG: ABC transporter permease [Candidatus Omnitrophica bacterium]|nr:ABC transporter permease [Candidatus Omnitrophota bacterium]
MEDVTRYEIIIKPNRSWFYIDWRGLLHYRDLLFLLIRRDFVSRYKQTILGPLWFIIQPLVMTLVFTVVFFRVAKVSTDALPPVLFYLCGLLIWNYFSSCISITSTSLTTNAMLFEKVYFPRIIIPLSTIFSNLITFAIQLLTFLCFYFYYKWCTASSAQIHPNLFLFALPLLLLQAAAFALGVGLWLSALTVKYRDLSFLMGFLVQLWMYATPVIYPVSAIPSQWRFILIINPIASIVDLYRYAFFGTLSLSLKYLTFSIITTCVVLFSGILIFNKVERTFIDTV